MVKKGLGRILLDDLALVHEDHPVGHGFGKAHFVGHAQHGDALFGQLNHHVQDLFDHFRVQRRGGFVKQHHLGRQAQCAGNGHPLLLTAGELQRVFVGLLGNAHPLELLHGALSGRFDRELAHLDGGQGEVFQHGQVGK